jgi:LmbE family N-acetylglucosaminyl deacetylase
VHAARSAAAAVASTGNPAKLYLTAMRLRRWREMWAALREAGVDMPDREEEFSLETLAQMEESERRITTIIDIRAVLDRKRAALLSHASQISESWFSQIPAHVAERVFGEETFIRAVDRTGAPVPETDLFAGLH